VETLTIVTQEETEKRKGRSFSAVKLAHVCANSLWLGGEHDNVRPVWLQASAPDAQLRAFVANLKEGRVAVLDNTRKDKFQILKSVGYRFDIQRECGEPGTSVATVWLPDLFVLDPGMVDPKKASFVVLPPLWWLEKSQHHALYREAAEHGAKHSTLTPEQLLPWVPVAVTFGAMLDRRTRRPIPPSPSFLVQLWLAFLRHGLARLAGSDDRSNDPWSWARAGGYNPSYVEYNIAEVGLSSGCAVHASHEHIDNVLSDEVAKFFGGRHE
jgi:hypothetical protein